MSDERDDEVETETETAAAADEAEDADGHDTADDEHEHDEEHEHEHEHDEEAGRRLHSLVAALANLDDASIQRAVAAMREQTRNELAEQLQLTKATMHLGDALPSLLRRKVLGASPERQLAAAFALSEGVNDHAIEALGENHEDPSRADLDAVLPDLIEQDGVPLVALMAAAYACSDARCQEVMGQLLDSDERFALPEPPAIEEAAAEVHSVTTFRRDAADPEQVAKREQRKAAKAAKREAEAHRREAAAAAQSARREAQHRANQQKTHK